MQFILQISLALCVVATVHCNCNDGNRQILDKADAFFSIGGKYRNALEGNKGFKGRGQSSINLAGKTTKHFYIEELCFWVKKAKSVNVVYEGIITPPKPDGNGGFSMVGPALSREAPISFPSKKQSRRWSQHCFKDRGTQSKVSVSVAGWGGRFMVKGLTMKYCPVQLP